MYILRNFDDNLKNILNNGFEMKDRTGVGCKYLPGLLTTVDISERVPVPTKRKTNWQSMLKEYLWFLSGSNNIQDLRNTGSKVWDFWDDEDWQNQNGWPKGSIGYGYGSNLIHYGADLNNPEDKGFNQIDYVIEQLKNNPESRRILFSFYRPDKSSSKDAKLPPCHCVYQFIPEFENGIPTKLSCCVYQRSGDMFVGLLSTNLQGAAFYTNMIAQQVNLKPSKLYHFTAHAHIYINHIPLVEEYLLRPEVESPVLNLNLKSSIYDYASEDFTLTNYEPLPSMKVPIAV